jgi:hypothetical protein
MVDNDDRIAVSLAIGRPSRIRMRMPRAPGVAAHFATTSVLFLHSNGVGTSRAVRIYKTYGADAVRLISENPYRLARDIRGIGFRTADQIAAKLGIEKTALIRVRAGISYALAEAMDEGHCGLPVEELVPLTGTYRWELHHLLNLCGLAVEAEYSDFVGSAPAYGRELILVARVA